jgi:hypothetical protein
MLRIDDETDTNDRRGSSAWRLATALGLLALTLGVATLRGPARAAEKATAAAATSGPLYLRDGGDGVVVMRPAATFRRAGMDRLAALLNTYVGVELAAFAEHPLTQKLDVQDIEWVTAVVSFGRGPGAKDNRHSLMLGRPAIRMVAPFDWLAYLRQWRFDFEEVQAEKGIYYRIKPPMQKLIGPAACVYLPDDRTMVLDDEASIRKQLGAVPAPPAYLEGPDWERASHGLFAAAINNHDGAFAKHYDLGRPDDAVLMSLFQDVACWTISVDDADSLGVTASAACARSGAGNAIARNVESLLKQGRAALERPDLLEQEFPADARAGRLVKALLSHVRVVSQDRSVQLRAEGCGTLADLASAVAEDAVAAKPLDGNEPEGTAKARK